MPKTYTPADRSVSEIGDVLIESHYPDLLEAAVTIKYLFVEGGKVPLKYGGYPAQAVVKVNPLDKRSQGVADAPILIDRDNWDGLTEPEQIALIDHECFHLVVKRHTRGEEEGQVKRDSAGRPMLACKPHDLVLGGFEEVARRHGAASAEVRAVRGLKDCFGQMLFEWPEVAGV